MMMMINH